MAYYRGRRDKFGLSHCTIDWIEFELYNTDSDHYPMGSIAGAATDFYIKSLAIIPEPGSGAVRICAPRPGATLARPVPFPWA